MSQELYLITVTNLSQRIASQKILSSIRIRVHKRIYFYKHFVNLQPQAVLFIVVQPNECHAPLKGRWKFFVCADHYL